MNKTMIRVISRREWNDTPADYKGGTIQQEPRMLSLEDAGTSLVPVLVVENDQVLTRRVWFLASSTAAEAILEVGLGDL